MNRPIVVLGFGRSGTTWLSDIISKALGGLLLFEPLHPAVCDFAREACYATGYEPELVSQLQSFLDGILNKANRRRWLLRNHLFTPLEDVSDGFVNMVWDDCEVIGFKDIRANFMIDWLIERYDARIVYVVRHPCAVLASVRRRLNFWKEFGWETHWRLFEDRVLRHRNNIDVLADARASLGQHLNDLEKQAVMWAATHRLVELQLARYGLPMFVYEDFYYRPFEATRRLVSYLGRPLQPLHPSYMFVPSMTTMRTVHGLTQSESSYDQKGEELFWKDILTDVEVKLITDLIAEFGIGPYGLARAASHDGRS